MKSLLKIALSALLALTVSSCEPWYYESPTFSILQMLQNNQPNTVYNQARVTYGGYTSNGMYEYDTLYFQRTILPGDTAQIVLENVLASRFYYVDTVNIDLALSDSQQWQQQFPRRFIRRSSQNKNDFIETIRF